MHVLMHEAIFRPSQRCGYCTSRNITQFYVGVYGLRMIRAVNSNYFSQTGWRSAVFPVRYELNFPLPQRVRYQRAGLRFRILTG
jgi:hypothetical protein